MACRHRKGRLKGAVPDILADLIQDLHLEGHPPIGHLGIQRLEIGYPCSAVIDSEISIAALGDRLMSGDLLLEVLPV